MSTASLQGCRILVVEDDYMIAQDVSEALEKAGAIVLGPVPSVSKALRLLDKEPAVDAAVLDVTLNNERSFSVAQALEARSIPFLFATGYDTDDVPPEWRHSKIVTKPLRIDAVEQLLNAGSSAAP